MDALLLWFAHWLPLVQGFAALASIGGAALSWKYALKAQRAREEMTQNVVSARLVEVFDTTISELQNFRTSSVLADGKVDPAAYVLKDQQNRRLLEEALAMAKAAEPYLRVKPETWSQALDSLTQAAISPNSVKIEYACKFLTLANAQLKLAASARQLSSAA